MAYATTNPPILIVPGFGTGGRNVWNYTSTDVRTTVEGAAYFSNGVSLGLKVGDTVFVVVNPGGLTTVHSVTAVTTTAATINAAVLA